MNALKILLILTLFLTAGCSWLQRSAPADNMVIPKETRQQQIQDMNVWTAKGAISITYQGRTDIGSFDWDQRGSRYDLKTYGPLNMAGLRIAGQPGLVQLWKSSQQPVSASTPEELMAREIGWYLPLTNFRYWSRGIPAPGSNSNKEFDRFGHLIQLNQQGWNIKYQQYQSVQGMDLPRTIIYSHDPVRVKMVIKTWKF